MKFCTRKFKFWQKFRRPSKFLRPGAPQAIPPKYSQNRDFSKSFFFFFEPQNFPPQACLGATKTRVSESFDRGDAFCTSICYNISKTRSRGLKQSFEEMRKIFMEKKCGKFLTFLKCLLELAGASF